MVAEKLPDELSELLRECGVERGLTTSSVSLLQVFPVALLVILVNVLIKEVRLHRLLMEGHHACYQNKQDDSQSKDVGSCPLIGLAFMNFWSHIALSPYI